MNERGQSDRLRSTCEPAEQGRGSGWRRRGRKGSRAKGNTASKTRPGRSAGPGASSALDRVREVARRDKEARFTALLHHVEPGPAP